MKYIKRNLYRHLLIFSYLVVSSIMTAASACIVNHKTQKQGICQRSDTLTKKELLIKIKKIISKILDVKPEDIKMQSSFTKDLGADDLSLVELILEFEEQFDITISDKDADTLTTVQKTYDYLIKRLKITS